MFLSLSTGYPYKLYYETDASPSSFVLSYYAISLVVFLTVMLMMLMLMMVIRSGSITCCHLSCKIRFESPNREWGRERGEKKVKEGKYRYSNSAQRWATRYYAGHI